MPSRQTVFIGRTRGAVFLPSSFSLLSLLPLSRRSPLPHSPKERKQTNQTRDGGRTRSPPARAGFWKDDQGHRGTGAGSASRHGGGLGRVHPDDGVPGIPLSYRTGCTRRHGGRRGPPTGCALLVLLLLTRGTATGSQHNGLPIPLAISRLATFLRLLTGSLSLPQAH